MALNETNAKILNVRIKNKYDSYEKWIDSDLILEAGEIAIAHTTINDVTVDNGTVKHPGLLMKVGDGEHTFSALPWLSAKAADVLSVCKNETSLKDFIKTVISANDGALKNLETALKALIKDEETRALAAEAELAAAITAEETRAKAAEEKIAKFGEDGALASGSLFDEIARAKEEEGKLAQAIVDAQAAAEKHADDLNTAMDTRMDAVEAVLTGGGEGTIADQIANVKSELEGQIEAEAKARDKAIEDAIDAEVEARDKAIEDAVKVETEAREEAVQGVQDAVDELAGTHATDKAALEKAVADEKTRAKGEEARIEALITGETGLANRVKAIEDDYLVEADKTELSTAITAEETRALAAEKVLTDDLAAEIARAKAAEKANSDAIALLVDSTEGDETKLNSIKELATWIEEHGGDAAEMAEAISDNAKAIADIYAVDAEGVKTGVLVTEITRVEGLVSAEAGRADAAEKANAQAILDEKARAEAAEKANADAIKALQDANAAGGAVAEAIADAKKAGTDAAAAVETLKNTEVKANADAIAQEVKDREAAITQEVTDRNQAIAGAVAKEVEDRNKAISDAIDAEVTNRNNAISGAIAQEVTDRNAAIATAKGEAATDATTKANQALADAKTHVAEEIAKLDGSVAVSSTKHVLTGVTEVDGKLTDKAEVELADIAFTGSTDDLVQGLKVLVFDCGTSANV